MPSWEHSVHLSDLVPACGRKTQTALCAGTALFASCALVDQQPCPCPCFPCYRLKRPMCDVRESLGLPSCALWLPPASVIWFLVYCWDGWSCCINDTESWYNFGWLGSFRPVCVPGTNGGFYHFCGFICSLVSVHHYFYSYRELLYRLCLFENIGWPMLCKDAEVWALSIRIFKRSSYGLNLDLLSLFKQLPLNFWA